MHMVTTTERMMKIFKTHGFRKSTGIRFKVDHMSSERGVYSSDVFGEANRRYTCTCLYICQIQFP